LLVRMGRPSHRLWSQFTWWLMPSQLLGLWRRRLLSWLQEETSQPLLRWRPWALSGWWRPLQVRRSLMAMWSWTGV
jgi:hypothetical protein